MPNESRYESPFVQPTHRERINKMMKKVIQSPTMVLTAFADHQNTTAVNTFVAQSKERVIWIRLKPSDCDENHFWDVFIDAISYWSKDLANKMKEYSLPNSKTFTSRFEQQLEQASKHSGRVIIVFCNFHVLSDGSVRALIMDLAQADVHNFSVIVMGEDKIFVNISGHTRPIDLVDQSLQLTREEARIYYTALNIVVYDEELDILMNLTEGWSVFIYMIGIHLRQGGPLTENHIDNALALMFKMLYDTFLSSFEEDIQEVLILLSQLDEFSFTMMEDLNILEEESLKKLFREIPFIQYRGKTDDVYFQKLFRKALQLKQPLLPRRERLKFLHDCAEWYGKKGRITKALAGYLACGEYSNMTNLLQQCDMYSYKEESLNIVGILEQVSKEDLMKHPFLWLYKVLFYYLCEQVSDGLEQQKKLSAYLEENLNTEEEKITYGELQIHLGILKMRQGRRSFVEYFREACGYLPEGTSVWEGETIRYINSGEVFPFPKEKGLTMEEMKKLVFEAAPYMRKLFFYQCSGLEYLSAAEFHFYRGELEEAVFYAGEAVAIAVHFTQWDIACNAIYLLIRIDIATGSLDDAEYNIKIMKEHAKHLDMQELSLIDVTDYLIYHFVGLDNLASDVVKDIDPEILRYSRLPNGGKHLYMKAIYMVIEKDYISALSFIDAAMGTCSTNGEWFTWLLFIILRAVIYDMNENYKIAAKYFQRAYEIASPHNIVMNFAEFGAHMMSLIKNIRTLPKGSYQISEEWMDMIYLRAEEFKKNKNIFRNDYMRRYPQEYSLRHKLTNREFETLQLLCKGLSNDEIAERMNVEKNSAKATLRRIYRKIGAVNRGDAVRIGLSEGIVW